MPDPTLRAFDELPTEVRQYLADHAENLDEVAIRDYWSVMRHTMSAGAFVQMMREQETRRGPL